VGRVSSLTGDSIPFRFGYHRKTKSFSIPTTQAKQFACSRSQNKNTPFLGVFILAPNLGRSSTEYSGQIKKNPIKNEGFKFLNSFLYFIALNTAFSL